VNDNVLDKFKKHYKDYRRQNSIKQNTIKIEENKPIKSGNGGLRNEDIQGSSPSKFGNRNRRVFMDRNEIKSVLGKRY
jgi:hypothetical protein